MITEGIIIAVITGLFSILGTWLINRRNKVEADVKRAEMRQATEDRLSRIEEKLDIHNGYADKLGDISVAIGKIETEISNIKERIK